MIFNINGNILNVYSNNGADYNRYLPNVEIISDRGGDSHMAYCI